MVESTIKEIWDISHRFYSNWLYPAGISILRFLVNNKDALWVLIAVVIVFSIVRSKVMFVKSHRILPGALDAVTGCLVVIIFIVAFFRFGLPAWNYLSSHKSDSETTKPSTPTQNPTKSNPTQNPTTPQTQKQLYYTASCYNCYSASCNRNGYSYGGYSYENWIYYKNICQNCQCTDSKSFSFWK